MPAQLRDPDGDWWGLSLRIRTPMRSTERVPADAVTQLRGPRRRALEGQALPAHVQQRVQPVARRRHARQARAGARRARCCESWMANEPQILGSDVDVLEAIAAGRCDVGLTNHYYLARELADDPDFPVAPAWPDQDGAGAHTNLSGVGLVKGAEHRADAIALMEHLTAPEAQREIAANGEFAANPDVPPAEHIRRLGRRQARPDRRRAGRRAAARRGRADAAGRVEVAAPRAGRGRGRARPPAWPVVGVLVALLVAGPLLRPARLVRHRPRRVRPDRRRPAARGAARQRRARARRRRRDAAARRRRSPRSSRSTTSPAGAGSTGRSCCRWRCRPTCSCSCCSASTTPTARCSARCATCSASGCPRSARPAARSPC